MDDRTFIHCIISQTSPTSQSQSYSYLAG